jgi:hypothetical protein
LWIKSNCFLAHQTLVSTVLIVVSSASLIFLLVLYDFLTVDT